MEVSVKSFFGNTSKLSCWLLSSRWKQTLSRGYLADICNSRWLPQPAERPLQWILSDNKNSFTEISERCVNNQSQFFKAGVLLFLASVDVVIYVCANRFFSHLTLFYSHHPHFVFVCVRERWRNTRK